MKKYLLLALAVLTMGTANAQLNKKVGKPIPQKNAKISQKSTFKHYQVAGEKMGVKAVADKTTKTMSLSQKQLQQLKPMSQEFKSFRAGEVQQLYNGTGTLRSTQETTTWEMQAGTATTNSGETVNVLVNVIPNIFGFENGVMVPYTVENGVITIQPRLVASFPSDQAPSGTYYLFLESATSNDGSIQLTLNENGGIDGTYNIIYSVYPNSTYNFEEWVGTYDGVTNAQYSLPGEVKVPSVSFEQANLVLFAGLGLNGYSFNNNLSMTGAYTTTNFSNLTTDAATAWKWSADDASKEEPTVFASGESRNFALDMKNDVVTNIQLVGVNQTAESEPFTYGIGKYLNDDGTPRYTASYLYAGHSENSWILNNETPAIVTRQDPDGDLTFYTNWATPDKASNEMTKIYNYFEKPATPLYITGVTLPLVSFTANDDFNLHIKIVKCTRNGSSKPTLGEVIAEGDATSENINATFDIGLTAIEIPLYKEDEDGMSTDLEYLFIDDEFVIVIENWNNGTFSGVLGSQDAPLDNARPSTWFEMAGEEGSMYAYTTWKTSLFIGLKGATYGYLHTADDTNITMPVEGGEVKINVEPMLVYNDEETDGLTTGLWLDDESEAIPEWLSFKIADHYTLDTEGYLDESNFDMIFTAEALPAGTEGRQANLVFMQPGARLYVTITQGTVTGINVTTKTVKTSNSPAYNLAGQRVNKDFKGLVIVNGKKVVLK